MTLPSILDATTIAVNGSPGVEHLGSFVGPSVYDHARAQSSAPPLPHRELGFASYAAVGRWPCLARRPRPSPLASRPLAASVYPRRPALDMVVELAV